MIPDDVQARLSELARTTPCLLPVLEEAWRFVRRRADAGDKAAAMLLDPVTFAEVVAAATRYATSPLTVIHLTIGAEPRGDPGRHG